MSNLKVNTIQNTSSVNAITIDTSGRVLYPQNPAFCARGCSNTTGNGPGRRIIFPTVDFNIGLGYNNGLGIFTAPVSGIYYFTYHLFGYFTNWRHYSVAQLNGISFMEVTQETTVTTGSGHSNLEGQSLLYMNQNDQLGIVSTADIIGSTNAYACFTGYLVGS